MKHQRIGQARIWPPGPGREQPGAALLRAEERSRSLRDRRVDELHAHAGLAELLDQDLLALDRVLIGIAADLDHRALLEACFRQQLTRLLWIIRIKLGNGFVVGPMRLRQVHVGGLGETGERRLDERHAVDREIEGLPHLDVIERGLGPVPEDLKDIERRPVEDLDVARALHDRFLPGWQLVHQIVLACGDRA